MQDIVIVAALRTAVGSFGGSLAKIPAPELGATVIKGLLAQTGVKPEDVKVEMEDGKLTISGKRETVKEEKTKNVHRVERTSGSFYRAIGLPREIAADQIEASYDQGVLHITLPKSAEKQPRKIEIRSPK